ncbi:lasso RiPP family leader peptide-containing protein [Streptomyces sp. CA-132043]
MRCSAYEPPMLVKVGSFADLTRGRNRGEHRDCRGWYCPYH